MDYVAVVVYLVAGTILPEWIQGRVWQYLERLGWL
jgi:hypothetical protein